MNGKSTDIAVRSRGHCVRGPILLALLTIVCTLPTSFGPAQAASSTVVSLTFNDGLTSQYLYARPALKAYGMTGTFYVASGWIDKSFACCMPWWQVDDLYRDGNEIGGMGTEHKDLTQAYYQDPVQDYAYKKQQVCGDRQRLVGLGYDPQTFAYPRAAYKYTFPDGSTVQGIVRDCGYRAARTVGGLSPTGPAYAETLPPKDAYALRTTNSASSSPLQLADLQNAVTSAASHGGGWIPLVFNQVCHQGDPGYSSCMWTAKSIDDSVFSALLDWLAKAGQPGGAPGGTVVRTVRQAMGAPPQPELPPRPTTVSLTFDDGAASQYQVRSMLSGHGMNATFYIPTGDMGMSWSDLQALADDGNEIGGHTIHHVDLTSGSLSYDQKVREVCDDRAELVRQGFNAESFAYPFGAYDRTAEDIVASCGYRSGRRAGGSVPTGPTYAETIPPSDPYAVRTVYRQATDEIKLAELTNAVSAAAGHGGGWVVFVFHQICTASAPGFDACMASYKPVQATTFNAFLDWLQHDAPVPTSVKTVGQVINGG
jgi:peptidoglycan/xylan/chitin deacetylase (PgdA/CDA1 family)